MLHSPSFTRILLVCKTGKIFSNFRLLPLSFLVIGNLLLSACGTPLIEELTEGPLTTLIGSPRGEHQATDHRSQANRYAALAKATQDREAAYEYHLRAADHYLKASQIAEARQVIRGLQNNAPRLDAQSQTNLLEARLALLQNDARRAQVMLDTLLAPFANNLQTEGETRTGHKIALLLPSSGPHAKSAKTIRDGFLAAYYKTLQHASSDPTVQVYDTGQGNDVEKAYRQALAEKADFIVGPLTKTEVQTIAGMSLDVPVLALNTIQDVGQHKKSGKLLQFGLIPEDEIAATVEAARKHGHKRAMIITPNDEWGQRTTDAFQQLWAHQGGETAAVIQIQPKEDLISQLETALQNPKTPKKADMIFLVASPEFARQIKPLISHYQKNNLPIYATASVYSGTPSPQLDHDLNGIHFCDMPWVIHPSGEQQDSKSLLGELWPTTNPSNPRYFALGMDAYHLASQLTQAGIPLSGMQGSTGMLHKEGQRIQRRLVCAKFEQGIPVPD